VLNGERRTWVACVPLAVPGTFVVAVDLARRGPHVVGFHGWSRVQYAAAACCSLLLWGALLFAASGSSRLWRRVASAVFVVLFSLAFAVQNAFYDLYRVYVAIDSLVLGDDVPRGVVAMLPLGRPPLSMLFGVGVLVALGMLALSRRFPVPERRPKWGRPVLAAGVLWIGLSMPVSPSLPVQSATPDLMYLHGVAVFVVDRVRRRVFDIQHQLVRVQRRTPEVVPALNATVPTRRNVVLLLQEAQRADVTCIAFEPDCILPTQFSNPLAPERLPFFQARAAASSTAIAVAVLWSGIDPTETRERMHSAPLVWEYARAAGYDTAYWTSQNVMFGNSRLFVQDLPLTAFATGSEIDPDSDVLTGADDELLVDRVIADWPKLSEPFFAVVHFSNIHRPRVIDPGDLPFQPTHLADKGGGEKGRNFYMNAVYRSDRAVARLLRHIRSTESGRHSVVVFTSDHGEAYGEHKNENNHSSTVYDEEIRIPFYIDAPEGLLSESEVRGFRENAEALVSQYDQSATLLSLLGVWDDAAFAPFRSHMLGTPVDRRAVERAVPLTNVSWVWEYHRPNWGMMQGSLKVLAQIEDPSYLCFDVMRDPLEKRPLHTPACAALIERANLRYGMLPKDLPRLRDRPDWGRTGIDARRGRE